MYFDCEMKQTCVTAVLQTGRHASLPCITARIWARSPYRVACDGPREPVTRNWWTTRSVEGTTVTQRGRSVVRPGAELRGRPYHKQAVVPENVKKSGWSGIVHALFVLLGMSCFFLQ